MKNPLDRLPSIRAKLGSVIVFAVGMTVLLVYVVLGIVRSPHFLLETWWQLLLGGALASAAALLAARFLAKGMTKPLRDMAQASRKMAQGDYSQRVVTASRDGKARIWSVATGKLLRTLEARGWLAAVAYSPDGKTLATLDQTARGNTRAPDNEVQLWDVADPENAAASATVHAPDTASGAVAVTPDGRLLAVTGIVARSGSETLLWNIADIRHPVALPGRSRESSVPSPGRRAHCPA